MSFIYPRKVSFLRPGAQTGVGAQGYGGQTEGTNTPIIGAQDLMCSIQARREGQNNTAGLPGDGTKPTWYVYIPKRVLANGTIKDRDIMIDDLGVRYQVIQPYWDSLGYRISAVTTEA